MPDHNTEVGIFNFRTEAETNFKGLSMSGTLMGCRYVGRKLATALVVIICFGFVSATSWAAPIDQQKMTDQQITNAVDHRLLSDSALYYDAATDSYEIKTAVKDGVVTLSGTVQFYGEKQLAVYVAKGVKGVKEVKDSISVSVRNKRPDVEITAEVNNFIAGGSEDEP